MKVEGEPKTTGIEDPRGTPGSDIGLTKVLADARMPVPGQGSEVPQTVLEQAALTTSTPRAWCWTARTADAGSGLSPNSGRPLLIRWIRAGAKAEKTTHRGKIERRIIP